MRICLIRPAEAVTYYGTVLFSTMRAGYAVISAQSPLRRYARKIMSMLSATRMYRERLGWTTAFMPLIVLIP